MRLQAKQPVTRVPITHSAITKDYHRMNHPDGDGVHLKHDARLRVESGDHMTNIMNNPSMKNQYRPYS